MEPLLENSQNISLSRLLLTINQGWKILVIGGSCGRPFVVSSISAIWITIVFSLA